MQKISRERKDTMTRMVWIWLHIALAGTWLGSQVFLALILPVLRRQLDASTYADVLHAIGVRLRWLGWMSIAGLVITGILNLGHLGYTWADAFNGHLWTGAFGRILMHKLGLVALIIVIMAVHDIWLGPKFTRQGVSTADDPDRERLRKWAAWLGRITVILTLVVFYLAVTLVRGGHP